MDLLNLRLVGAVGVRISEELIITTVIHRDPDLNPEAHGCEPSALPQHLFFARNTFK